MMEATHFSQCVHDQQRRLEAEDCDSIRCAQLISGWRRRIRPPCTVPRSHLPTMRCIRLVINYGPYYSLYCGLWGMQMQYLVQKLCRCRLHGLGMHACMPV